MKNVCVFAFVLLMAGSVAAGETYTDTDFSYDVPPGWRLLPPQDKYKIAAGPRKGAVSPNINIASVVTEREFNMEKFVLDVLGNLKLDAPNSKKTGEADFKSDTGLKCKKLSMTDYEQGKHLLQYFYLFTGQGKSLIVCCTTTPEDAAAEASFDAAMKSLKILK